MTRSTSTWTQGDRRPAPPAADPGTRAGRATGYTNGSEMVTTYLRQLGYDRDTAHSIAAAIALDVGNDPAAALERAMALPVPDEDWRNLPDITEAPLVFTRQDIKPPSLHRLLRRLRATAATRANDG